MLDVNDEIVPNPLDSVEDVLSGNNWVYSRTHDDELTLKLNGRTGTYHLFFIWQENMNALQFIIEFDTPVSMPNAHLVSEAVMKMNTQLWMGHFEIEAETLIPLFRHNRLLCEQTPGLDRIGDLVDIALAQCERFYSVFHLLSQEKVLDTQTLVLAMMDTTGES